MSKSASVAALALLVGCEAPVPPGPVVDLRVTPDSAHLVPGETVELTVTPIGESGDPLPERVGRVRWAMADEAVADFELVGTTGRLTARELGTAHVEVELGQGRRVAAVFIHPAELASIAIEPSPVEAGVSILTPVRAVLLDAAGEELDPAGFRVSWMLSDTTEAFINGETTAVSGVLVREPGTRRLTLIVNDFVTATEVVVR